MLIGVTLLPVVEFITHKYVLHWLDLARTSPTAQFWNRVHYAHHMDPKDTRVILAHPPPWCCWWRCWPASLVRRSDASRPHRRHHFGLFAFYEIVHFACHMDGDMRSAYFTRRRQEHALHHYVDENRNYGITTAVADRLFGTRIVDKKTLVRSPTARNLGYTGAFADRYPFLKTPEARKDGADAA